MNLSFVCLLCLFIQYSSSTPINNLKCSRQNSKLIREYFARVILPVYQQLGVPIPQECEFSPLNDVYYYQENNKTKEDTMKWKCELCGKVFLTEFYLDKHLSNKHNDSLHLSPNGSLVCLADLCPIFRCDVLQHNFDASKEKKCAEADMRVLRERCDVMVHTCIPKSISPDLRQSLTIELNEKICSYLDCEKYTQLPHFMTMGPNFLTILLIVVFIGICIIVYAVLNHTDLIFDENEPVVQDLGPPEEDEEDEVTRAAVHNQHKFKSLVETGSYPPSILSKSSEVRHRKTVTFKETSSS